ncbi:uncharacterized protein FIESC28_04082 [Fusarium coffeatum]|uniref:Uncharacterized protein n=1 Tax=Fusarium coffeatum TaxID=231269 RepID=A0A366S177_9HYPO|nr:uncharacterized protein FIESC28_04082 [Fusarium coffeatum]RBR23087.1 hypothetical protein FIESC28_04082 [Fusarium coffeatum]
MANSDVHLEDSQVQQRDEIQTLQRMQRDQDALLRHQQQLEDHNRELQNTNNYLRGEVADLRAQLSYATQTLTARIQEQVDGARATGVSEGRLRDVVDEQRQALQNFVRENKAATRRIQELQQGQRGDPATPANGLRKTKGQRRHDRAAEQRQTQQRQTQNAPRLPSVAPTVTGGTAKYEQGDSIIVLDDDEEDKVPGLPLVEDCNLDDDVIEQLNAIMKKRTGKKNLLAFLEHGARNKSFCGHEITSKGQNASKPLLSSQPCRIHGCNYTFRAKAVETDSGVKMRITPFIP